jgi:hypothetical protein
MSILTPSAAQRLVTFGDTYGSSMRVDRDVVHPNRWMQGKYADLQVFIAKFELAPLPLTLSRDDIIAVAQVGRDFPRAFLYSQMWGYQSDPRGAYRTNLSVSEAKSSGVHMRIEGMLIAALEGELRTAFSLMRSKLSRIFYVNTAFATKLFYFAGFDESKPIRRQPLILDARVVVGLHKTLNDPFALTTSLTDLTLCTFDQYAWYLDLVKAIRDEYVPEIGLDVVELWLWNEG